MKPINVLSLFGGIECGRIAMDRLGWNIGSYYSAEIDPYPIEIVKANYPDIVHIGNVKNVELAYYGYGEDDSHSLSWQPLDDTAFPEVRSNTFIDLLIGGSPCQDLSIAGNRKGLSGERSGLFYEYVRILNETKPRFFLMENVASMTKDAKEEITRQLFGIEPVMINSALVSAQNRKRLYWVGRLNDDGTYSRVEIPQPEDREIALLDILEDIPLDDPRWKPLPEKYREQVEASVHKFGIFQIPRGKNGGGMKGADKIPTVNASKFQDNNFLVYVPEKSLTINANYAKASIANIKKSGHQVILGEDHGSIYYRKLTVRECARAQSIPDSYTFDSVFDSRAYKAIGNGWTVDVIKHILSFCKF